MTQTESRIQQQIVQWYTNTYCLAHHSPRHCIFHVPNQNQQRLSLIGVMAGVSDLIILHGTQVLFVEVKDAKGKQSPKQTEFEYRAATLSHPYAVVRSLEDFKNFISNL